MKRTIVVVTLMVALLVAFFMPAWALEPTHSNGAAAEEPAPEAEQVRLLLVALPGARVLEAFIVIRDEGPALVVMLHTPHGTAAAVLPW